MMIFQTKGFDCAKLHAIEPQESRNILRDAVLPKAPVNDKVMEACELFLPLFIAFGTLVQVVSQANQEAALEDVSVDSSNSVWCAIDGE